MTHLPLLAATAFSLATIFWLWRGDPKRRRVAGLPPIKGHGTTARRLALVAILLPGIGLAALGDSAAFLIWLGGCAIGGWLVAQIRYRSDA
ncbi:hypothetical protein SAMN05518801_10621 [Novosphingobium sp. CF614]|uniref:hypothetical protein n=1 Tax=Novosphingobium sp. CF614 TaxID=1884364 RepID=UPI0008EAF7B0|nr:hypothetical protein [Novosphingobium sp. CF614]SFG03553.1 hypothetical protein SAMN05518801_10621 [Novosphingobium sp. CF614]